MMIAMRDGNVLIKDADSGQYATIKSWGLMTWSKRENSLCGRASLDLLDKLKTVIRLPPDMEMERQHLELKHSAIEWQRMLADPSPLFKYPVKPQMFKHQIRGANMALLTFDAVNYMGVLRPQTQLRPGRGFGFLFEMGTGKTLTAIAVAGALFQQHLIKRVLIVAPTSVCSVWPEDFTNATYKTRITMLLGSKKARLDALADLEVAEMITPKERQALSVAIINYESTWRDGIVEALQRYNADLIICDESQRIKTHNAAQSKAMHALGDAARYKLILTGTPIQNNAVDFYSQYRFLDAGVFGTNYYAFRNRYCVMGGFEKHQIVAYRNTDELIQKSQSIAYRVTKAEALDLPEETFENRYCDFDPAAAKMYRELRIASIAELENGERVTATTVLTKLLRLQQMTGGFLTADDATRPEQVNTAKLDALDDILQDYVIDSDGKLVIFARFRAEINAICKRLTASSVRHCVIDGTVPIESRGAIVDSFQNDQTVKVFVAQIQTAGLGITLHAASVAVFYSIDFNYANYTQALARIHRIGQKQPCTYIHLIVPGTIDEKVLKTIQKKDDFAKSVVDNWRSYI
jgi:Superfamily II DNA/RNA helicases, SNF2 family